MSDFYTDRDARGIPVELLLLQLCRLRGIPAQLNAAKPGDLEALRAYDLLIAGIPVDVKADWMSWSTKNMCVEKASLDHTLADYFAYAFPLPSGLTFHMFAVDTLKAAYAARNDTWDEDSRLGYWKYRHLQVGDQENNMAVLLPMEIRETVGEPFWKWAKTIKQQAA